MSIQSGTVKTDSFEMNYFCCGSGETPFVILPGLSVQSVMGAADAVAAEYALLAQDYKIYVFDRRTDLPEEYSIRDMAADTAEAMRALGLEKVCLFGASQGGMIAMVIAIEYPELVAKLILGSTSAHVQEQQYKAVDNWIRLAREKDAVGLYLDFGKEIYPPAIFEQYRDALIAAGKTVSDKDLERFIQLASSIHGFDVSGKLDRIQCPVLAIGVFEDAVLDSDATMEIAEKLDEHKDFRLYMYIGYGHAAFDTAPDYRERILAFLKNE
ncbi:MAG: alpha/beta hydrolase [Lachnospiraceae bacterium]|nr:alpha/beta hydrolase [Lachnospiraceae bacterium]MBQ9611956.1 alpha/beta hydrolase [Lachnospiraceae bacterium]